MRPPHDSGGFGHLPDTVAGVMNPLPALTKLTLARPRWRIHVSTPNGIRTRAATLRGWCPGPLDDGGQGGSRDSRELHKRNRL